MKTADHFWTDPSADELVQRHRIHGGHCRQDSPTKRPALCVSADKRCSGRLPMSSGTVIGTPCSAALGLSGSTALITVVDKMRKKQFIIFVQRSELVQWYINYVGNYFPHQCSLALCNLLLFVTLCSKSK